MATQSTAATATTLIGTPVLRPPGPVLPVGREPESVAATNYLGGALLTELLLPALKRGSPARVVTVASKYGKTKVDFDDQDPLQHNLAIYSADPIMDKNAKTLFKGDVVNGPKMMTYSVPALTAGTYHFHCDIHPTQMYGTFVVK